jgi:hypothetical protein
VRRRTRNPFEQVDVQVQQATRLGRHQLIAGYQAFGLDKATRCSETISFEHSDQTFDNAIDSDGRDTGSHAYARDEIQLAPWLHASAGVAYQQVAYDDQTSSTGFEAARWSPRLGIAARVTPRTVVRGAAFRQLHINLFASSIAPPTIAGFVVARNEFPTATRTEYNVSVEHSARRTFFAVRAFARDTEVPYLLEGESFIPEADASQDGAGGYVNWIAHERVTVFGEDQFLRFRTDRFDRYDNLARAGINLIHPRGLFLRLAAGHVRQRFGSTSVRGLPASSFAVGDLRFEYEFASKRGLASLEVTNALDQRFDSVVENLVVDPLLPRRRVVAALRWRLW